jgi:hypothetical protein
MNNSSQSHTMSFADKLAQLSGAKKPLRATPNLVAASSSGRKRVGSDHQGLCKRPPPSVAVKRR